MPTTCVWLDGLANNITEQYLTRHFLRYGHVVKVRTSSDTKIVIRVLFLYTRVKFLFLFFRLCLIG